MSRPGSDPCSVARYEPLFENSSFVVGDYHCRQREKVSKSETVRSDELVFVRNGFFVARVRNREIAASPNSVLRFDESSPYSVEHPLAGGDDCTVITVGPGVLDEMGIEPALRQWNSRTVSGPTFLLQSMLWNAARKRDDAWRIEELGWETIAAAFDQPTPIAIRSTHAAVRTATEFIMNHFTGSFTLEDVARHTTLSSFHLTRLFRAHTGLALHQFRMAVRGRAAVQRLLDGEHDLTSLALDLGFSDHSHFTNAFRKQFGMTPSSFRQQATGNRQRATGNGQRATGEAISS